MYKRIQKRTAENLLFFFVLTHRSHPVYTEAAETLGREGDELFDWCILGLCALMLGLAIFIVAIFPVGALMFIVAFLLITCGIGCMRRR